MCQKQGFYAEWSWSFTRDFIRQIYIQVFPKQYRSQHQRGSFKTSSSRSTTVQLVGKPEDVIPTGKFYHISQILSYFHYPDNPISRSLLHCPNIIQQLLLTSPISTHWKDTMSCVSHEFLPLQISISQVNEHPNQLLMNLKNAGF